VISPQRHTEVAEFGVFWIEAFFSASRRLGGEFSVDVVHVTAGKLVRAMKDFKQNNKMDALVNTIRTLAMDAKTGQRTNRWNSSRRCAPFPD
jgi:hypothetical protein